MSTFLPFTPPILYDKKGRSDFFSSENSRHLVFIIMVLLHLAISSTLDGASVYAPAAAANRIKHFWCFFA